MNLKMLIEGAIDSLDVTDAAGVRTYILWYFLGSDPKGSLGDSVLTGPSVKHFPDVQKLFPSGFGRRLAPGAQMSTNTYYKYLEEVLKKEMDFESDDIKATIKEIHSALNKWLKGLGVNPTSIQCPHCSEEEFEDRPLEIDHVEGVNQKSGQDRNTWENIRIMCGFHNRSRKGKDV